MTLKDVIDYEVYASWWACWVWWGWGQSLAAWWYRRKARRKYRRFTGNRRMIREALGRPIRGVDLLPFARDNRA